MLVIVWLACIVAANLLVGRFGPSVTPYAAFALIGGDLTTRDELHARWSGHGLKARMAGLIALGGLISYALGGPTQIAVASCVSFVAATIVDTLVFASLRGHRRGTRVNVSNIASAVVDSLVFPTLAFGGVMWAVSFGQFTAKVAGGAVWLLLLRRRR